MKRRSKAEATVSQGDEAKLTKRQNEEDKGNKSEANTEGATAKPRTRGGSGRMAKRDDGACDGGTKRDCGRKSKRSLRFRFREKRKRGNSKPVNGR